jgi:hypothetical protein
VAVVAVLDVVEVGVVDVVVGAVVVDVGVVGVAVPAPPRDVPASFIPGRPACTIVTVFSRGFEKCPMK